MVCPGIGVIPVANPVGITVNLSGVPGQSYTLETTTNLTAPAIWLPLATNIVGTNGLWQFTDPQYTNFSQRFYRLQNSQ